MKRDELVALLEKPSRLHWRRLCEALPSLSAEDIEACHALLASWPAALRVLPGAWLWRLYHGEEVPYLPLVSCLDAVQFESVRPTPYAWAKAPGLSSLSIFRLYDEAFGDEGAFAFANSLYLNSITELMLSRGITDHGAEILASSPKLARVQSLNVQRNQLTSRGVSALVRSPYLRELRALHLGRNPLDLKAAEALREHTFSLSKLDLDGANISGEMLRVLCASGSLRGLKELNLSNNRIGRAGCEALAACPELASLEILFLHSCGLEDTDVEILLRGSALRGLQNLALSENHLTDQGVALLAESEHLSDLTELDVCHNPFTVEAAAQRLQEAPGLSRVRRLCV